MKPSTMLLYYTPVTAVVASILLPEHVFGFVALGATVWYGSMLAYGVFTHRPNIPS